MVNAVFLLASAGLMALTGWKDLATLIYVILVTLTVGGVAAHFIAPPLLNAIGRAVSAAPGEKYKDMTYDELLYDEHRMYFAVLLFTTLKLFLYTMLVCVCAGLIK